MRILVKPTVQPLATIREFKWHDSLFSVQGFRRQIRGPLRRTVRPPNKRTPLTSSTSAIPMTLRVHISLWRATSRFSATAPRSTCRRRGSRRCGSGGPPFRRDFLPLCRRGLILARLPLSSSHRARRQLGLPERKRRSVLHSRHTADQALESHTRPERLRRPELMLLPA